MKQNHLAFILAFTISLEMIVAPVAGYAQTTNTNSTANTVSNAIDVAAKVWATVSNLQNSAPTAQQNYDMQNLSQQQVPSADKYFTMAKLSQIPGLVNYLAMNNINPQMLECKTLPTTLFEAKPEVCRIGVMTDKNQNPQSQVNEMYSYMNQYTQIDKMYRNYSASSNSGGQIFGVGCMKNAMDILNGFFQYRMNELDKLTTNLEAIQAQFKESSKSDLDAIDQAVAVLNGGGSDLTNEQKSKNPDLFDYGKRFDNPACSSMMSKDQFNQVGAKGLNAINKNLTSQLDDKPQGSKYSGRSYANANTSVVADINSLADKAAKQFQLNYKAISSDPGQYSSFLKGLSGSVSSTNGINNALTPDTLADAQTSFLDQASKLSDERATIINELTSANISTGNVNRLLGDLNSSSFESELSSIENTIETNCLSQQLSGTSSLDNVMKRIYQRGVSDYANKNAANTVKDELKKIIENTQTGFDDKIAALKALDASQGSRYTLKLDSTRLVQYYDEATGTIQTKTRDASVLQTPSSFLVDTIQNCKAQFKVNKIGSQMSGEAAIQRLRTLNQNYKNMATTQAAALKSDIKDKLINCGGNADIANNTASGSCTSSLFNPAAPGFCANAALSCSKNMQACSQQAQKFVKEIKTQMTARVNNYKALLNKNKKDVIKIFDSALSRYMQDGEKLRGIFGAGFSSPSGIQREVMPESARYLSDVQSATANSDDGALLLEDPDKYMAMFKDNIALLKESVKAQQDQILGGSSVGNNTGILAKHIQETERNLSDVSKQAAKLASTCQRQLDRYLQASEQQRNQQQADMMKQQSELGEKRQDICSLYSAIDINPSGVCNGGFKDLMQIDAVSIANLQQHCAEIGNEVTDDNITSLSNFKKAGEACKKTSLEKDKALFMACERWTKKEPSCVQGNGDAKLCTNYSTGEDDLRTILSSVMSTPNDEAQGISNTPYYCNAADNSGRGIGDTLIDNLQKSLTAPQAVHQE